MHCQDTKFCPPVLKRKKKSRQWEIKFWWTQLTFLHTMQGWAFSGHRTQRSRNVLSPVIMCVPVSRHFSTRCHSRNPRAILLNNCLHSRQGQSSELHHFRPSTEITNGTEAPPFPISCFWERRQARRDRRDRGLHTEKCGCFLFG